MSWALLLCSRSLARHTLGFSMQNAAYACRSSKLILQVGSLSALHKLYLAGCSCFWPQAAASLLHMAPSILKLQPWSPAIPIPHRECKPGAK